MKNVILLTLLVISIHAFAQGPGPATNQQKSFYNSICKFQQKREEAELRLSGFEIKRDLIAIRNPRSLIRMPTVQLYDSIYGWTWDATLSEWLTDFRFIDITYDNRHNMTSATGQVWNGSTWDNFEQQIYEYDAADNQIAEIYKQWYGNAWWNSLWITRDYDIHNHVTSETFLDGSGNGWVNYLQRIFNYDNQGNLLSDIFKNWSIDHWQNVFQDMYVYDADNRLTSETTQYWIGDIWKNRYYNTLNYDDNDSLILEVHQVWNTDVWENATQSMYVYDIDLHQTILTEQEWTGSRWDERYRYINTFNEGNKLSSLLTLFWNQEAWENNAQIVNDYDDNYNLVRETYYDWSGEEWIRNLQNSTVYDEHHFVSSLIQKAFLEDGMTISEGDSIVAFYHTITALEESIAKDPLVSVFPNPGYGSFIIQGEQIQAVNIFTAIGQKIYSIKPDEGSTYVDLIMDKPIAGMYMMQISDNGRWVTKQVIIQ